MPKPRRYYGERLRYKEFILTYYTDYWSVNWPGFGPGRYGEQFCTSATLKAAKAKVTDLITLTKRLCKNEKHNPYGWAVRSRAFQHHYISSKNPYEKTASVL